MELDLTIEKAIYDIFAYDEDEIVVLNNRQSTDNEFNKLLLLGRVIRTPFGNSVVPVNEDEYDEIAKYYLTLKSAFLNEEDKADE